MTTPPIIDPHPPMVPTTTLQEDITLAGQRRINLIWEYTQAILSVIVVAGNMGLAVWGSVHKEPSPIPESMTNALFLIVGFYFSRTNHAAIGGIGVKAQAPYEGR